jgi:hypothetical protein
MKKLVFGLIATVMFGLVGNAQNGNTEPNLKSVQFSEPTVFNSSKIKVSIDVDWGRVSKGCTGWGICGGTITITFKTVEGFIFENNPEVTGLDTKNVLAFEISNSIDSNLNMDLVIDKDVTLNVMDTKVLLKAGTYKLTEGLSKFGNYFIPIY